MTNQPTHDVLIHSPRAGIPMLLVAILLMLTAIPFWAVAGTIGHRNEVAIAALVVLGVLMILIGLLVLRGLLLVNPNQSKVVILFGRYVGTIAQAGFWWVNPFTVRKLVSLRIRNFQSDKLKVNDLRGNPIEIAAIVVWRVHDSAQATFDVEDYEEYVSLQGEAAIRALAASHPYDTPHAGEVSLRGRSEQVNAELMQELGERLTQAGVEVIEVRISHLAYAPEIAGAMLRRQQAEAIIDARSRIVDGAVGMVQMALEHLEQREVLTLDDERKAAMVSNLLVVLCSDHDATPVVNAGTLYQ